MEIDDRVRGHMQEVAEIAKEIGAK